MRRCIAALLVAMSMSFLAGCASPGNGNGTSGAHNSTTQEPAELIRDRCTRCHTVGRIKEANHDREAWDATISRMRSRGADVTDDDAARIAEFLTDGGGSKL